MKKISCMLMVLALAGVAAAATMTITDDFSDGDYTTNPAWTVVNGTFDASGGSLKFGTAAGTAIALDFPSLPNTAMSASFKLHQMNGTNASYTFHVSLVDTDSGLSYRQQASCNPNHYTSPGGNSGFHSRNATGEIIIGKPESYGRSLFEAYPGWPTVTMNFDPATGVEFYFYNPNVDAAPVLMAQWTNYHNLTKVDRLLLSNGNGVVTWYVDDVVVEYVPEPATMALLALGGLFLRRRR